MQTDYSVFPERLAEACRARNMTRDKLCASIGMGGRCAADFLLKGLNALDELPDKLPKGYVLVHNQGRPCKTLSLGGFSGFRAWLQKPGIAHSWVRLTL